jgi:WD40 repeat protein
LDIINKSKKLDTKLSRCDVIMEMCKSLQRYEKMEIPTIQPSPSDLLLQIKKFKEDILVNYISEFAQSTLEKAELTPSPSTKIDLAIKVIQKIGVAKKQMEGSHEKLEEIEAKIKKYIDMVQVESHLKAAKKAELKGEINEAIDCYQELLFFLKDKGLIDDEYLKVMEEVEERIYQLKEGKVNAHGKIREFLIGQIPNEAELISFGVTNDMKRFFYVFKKKSRYCVVIDGTKAYEYERIWTPAFSPDGERFAYIAREGNKILFVVNSEVQEEHEKIWASGISDLIFSPNSKHYAYKVWRKNKGYRIVYDGREQKEYDEIRDIFFSHNGEHLGYVARQGERWFVVKDGEEGKGYIGDKNSPISLLKLSEDGKHFLYRVHQAGKFFLVFDGKELKAYQQVMSPIFTKDGKHFAFISYENGYSFVKDGVEYGKYEWAGSLTLAQDGKSFVFWALKDKQPLVVHVSELLREYIWKWRLPEYGVTFSPDGKHIAYVVWEPSREENVYVILDGKEHRRYKGVSWILPIGNLIFSPDSNHLAYIVHDQSEKEFVVLDEKEQRKYDFISELVFSPDSEHLAYIASKEGKMKDIVVLDGEEIVKYQEIFKLAFVADAKVLNIFALTDNNLLRVEIPLS